MIPLLAEAASEMPITFGHVIGIAAVVGAGMAVLNTVGNLFSSWLQSKLPTSKAERATLVLEQAQACKYDHQGIKEILVAMNANIANAVSALTAMANADALRHQKVLEHLRALRRRAGHSHAEIGDIDEE
jgi:hypothetical protein